MLYFGARRDMVMRCVVRTTQMPQTDVVARQRRTKRSRTFEAAMHAAEAVVRASIDADPTSVAHDQAIGLPLVAGMFATLATQEARDAYIDEAIRLGLNEPIGSRAHTTTGKRDKDGRRRRRKSIADGRHRKA